MLARATWPGSAFKKTKWAFRVAFRSRGISKIPILMFNLKVKIAADGANKWYFTWLMRPMRSIYLNQALASEAVFMHQFIYLSQAYGLGRSIFQWLDNGIPTWSLYIFRFHEHFWQGSWTLIKKSCWDIDRASPAESRTGLGKLMKFLFRGTRD